MGNIRINCALYILYENGYNDMVVLQVSIGLDAKSMQTGEIAVKEKEVHQ